MADNIKPTPQDFTTTLWPHRKCLLPNLQECLLRHQTSFNLLLTISSLFLRVWAVWINTIQKEKYRDRTRRMILKTTTIRLSKGQLVNRLRTNHFQALISKFHRFNRHQTFKAGQELILLQLDNLTCNSTTFPGKIVLINLIICDRVTWNQVTYHLNNDPILSYLRISHPRIFHYPKIHNTLRGQSDHYRTKDDHTQWVRFSILPVI